MTELDAWQKRALQAETKLQELAQMPNDSIGWKDLKKTKAMQALESLDIPEKVLVYLRPSADTELPAELCIRDEEGVHNVYGMTPRAMLQVVRVAVEIIQNSKHFK